MWFLFHYFIVPELHKWCKAMHLCFSWLVFLYQSCHGKRGSLVSANLPHSSTASLKELSMSRVSLGQWRHWALKRLNRDWWSGALCLTATAKVSVSMHRRRQGSCKRSFQLLSTLPWQWAPIRQQNSWFSSPEQVFAVCTLVDHYWA